MSEQKPIASIEFFDIYLEGTKFRVYKHGKPFSPDTFSSVDSARNWCKRNMQDDFKPIRIITRVNDYNARSYIGELTITKVYFDSYNDMKIRLEGKRIDGRNHNGTKDNFYFLFEANENNLGISRRIIEIWDARKRLQEEEGQLERELTGQLKKEDILRLGGIVRGLPTTAIKEG